MKTWEEELDEIRMKRRDQILEAARELFLEKDMAQITMVDIVAKAGVSRVTLYKYFNSIHEIVFEIQIKIMNEISWYFEVDGNSGKTGADKLGIMMNGWLQLYREQPDHLRFIGMFDHFYRSSFPSEELRKRYKNSMEDRGEKFKAAIEEGMRDGSLHNVFDPIVLETMIQNTLISMVLRMATRGHLIQKQWGVDPEHTLIYLMQFMSQFVRTNPDLTKFELSSAAALPVDPD
ncbi:TetR/AcrR family transcriptional regulator [Paenibacillus rhizovicinus]|uniref:TetR/AcrR family transcriptional regulator n=1 Tax=Paenibacillus rhizovicinus TaxID=2704463 RepID=A0A6C0PAA6_9BACL|nr:TetR/AcrR family transcriptional regulator [Paenibacillus rhizovicinus]QHW33462.1 TetR/AcrR family transcriptional regulator [Paenibacillus rhizovicinus]